MLLADGPGSEALYGGYSAQPQFNFEAIKKINEQRYKRYSCLSLVHSLSMFLYGFLALIVCIMIPQSDIARLAKVPLGSL